MSAAPITARPMIAVVGLGALAGAVLELFGAQVRTATGWVGFLACAAALLGVAVLGARLLSGASRPLAGWAQAVSALVGFFMGNVVVRP